jgi:hypothetical protein
MTPTSDQQGSRFNATAIAPTAIDSPRFLRIVSIMEHHGAELALSDARAHWPELEHYSDKACFTSASSPTPTCARDAPPGLRRRTLCSPRESDLAEASPPT